MSKGNAATLDRGAALPQESHWRIKPIWDLSLGAFRDFAAALVGKDVLVFNVLSFFLGRVSILGELMPFGLGVFYRCYSLQKNNCFGCWHLDVGRFAFNRLFL